MIIFNICVLFNISPPSNTVFTSFSHHSWMMSNNVITSFTPECNGGVARKMARFLWQFCRNCHKSPFFGRQSVGNRLRKLVFCTNFPRSFLPTCWKSRIFEKLMQKRACLAVSIAPTALRSEAIATADWSGICKGFFLWQLPLSPTAAPNCHRSRYLYPLPSSAVISKFASKWKGNVFPSRCP